MNSTPWTLQIKSIREETYKRILQTINLTLILILILGDMCP